MFAAGQISIQPEGPIIRGSPVGYPGKGTAGTTRAVSAGIVINPTGYFIVSTEFSIGASFREFQFVRELHEDHEHRDHVLSFLFGGGATSRTGKFSLLVSVGPSVVFARTRTTGYFVVATGTRPIAPVRTTNTLLGLTLAGDVGVALSRRVALTIPIRFTVGGRPEDNKFELGLGPIFRVGTGFRFGFE